MDHTTCQIARWPVGSVNQRLKAEEETRGGFHLLLPVPMLASYLEASVCVLSWLQLLSTPPPDFQLSRGSAYIIHHLPFAPFVLRVVIASHSQKFLGASTSFVGSLNSAYTSKILSLKSLQLSHQSRILFLLWPWLKQARWCWYCMTHQIA